MTDLDKMARELFLAWLPATLPRDSYIDDDGDEQYFDDLVQGAWIGFRAALLTAPPGYVLVPVEPTQEMLDEVCSSDGIEPWTDDVMASTYRAMIAAAPEVK